MSLETVRRDEARAHVLLSPSVYPSRAMSCASAPLVLLLPIRLRILAMVSSLLCSAACAVSSCRCDALSEAASLLRSMLSRCSVACIALSICDAWRACASHAW